MNADFDAQQQSRVDCCRALFTAGRRFAEECVRGLEVRASEQRHWIKQAESEITAADEALGGQVEGLTRGARVLEACRRLAAAEAKVKELEAERDKALALNERGLQLSRDSDELARQSIARLESANASLTQELAEEKRKSAAEREVVEAAEAWRKDYNGPPQANAWPSYKRLCSAVDRLRSSRAEQGGVKEP